MQSWRQTDRQTDDGQLCIRTTDWKLNNWLGGVNLPLYISEMKTNAFFMYEQP